MIEKIIGTTGFLGMVVGLMGMAGAVESDASIKPALIITLISMALLGGIAVYEELRNDEENYTEINRDDFNRPYFLH